jgi:hypothetical protein
MKEQILDCLAVETTERPSFLDILFRLDKIDFRMTGGVKRDKVRRFVNAVQSREENLGIEINDFE